MIRHIRTLAASAVALAGSLAAQAQFNVVVTAPANVAGPLTRFYRPDYTAGATTNWGFGNPDAVPAVTAEAKLALPDTGLCSNAPAGYFAGKIAVIRRAATFCAGISPGATNARFGARARKAVRAGAVGVLFVDVQPGLVNSNVTAITTTFFAGDSGGAITVPVACIHDSVFKRLVPSIVAGTCSLQIGTVTNAYPYNLNVTGADVATPPFKYIPYYKIVDSGSVRFKPVMAARNQGSAAAAAVKYKCVINRLTPAFSRLYSDSVEGHNIQPPAAGVAFLDSTTTRDDARNSPAATLPGFKMFYLTENPVDFANRGDYKGKYEIVYSAENVGQTDATPADNVVTKNFFITDSVVAACSLSETPEQEVQFTGAATNPGGGPIKWSIFFKQPVDAVSKVTSISFTATSDADSLGGESVYGEVNQWDDANADGIISDDELTLVGQTVVDYNSNSERYKIKNVRIYDINSGDLGAVMLPGKNYLLGISYTGQSTVFIGYDEDMSYDFYSSFTTFSDTVTPHDNGGTWVYAYTGFNPVAVKAGINDITLGTKPSVGTIEALTAYPNPATDALRVNVVDKKGAGKAILTVTDLAGHTLQTEEVSLAGRVTTHKLSTASMAAGLYQLTVKTEGGQRTIRFAVGR